MTSLNMIKSCFMLIVLHIGLIQFANAQNPNKDGIFNEGLSIYSVRVEDNWYWLKPEIEVSSKEFFTKFAIPLELTLADSMKLVRQLTDNAGVTILRYQQYHKSIKVEYAECILEAKNDQVRVVHGRLGKNLNLPNSPAVSESVALTTALSTINAKKYAWQDDSLRLLLRNQNPNASWYPKAELIYTNLDRSGDEKNRIFD